MYTYIDLENDFENHYGYECKDFESEVFSCETFESNEMKDDFVSDKDSESEYYCEIHKKYKEDTKLYIYDDIKKTITLFINNKEMKSCIICNDEDINSDYNFMTYCKYDSKTNPKVKKICYECYYNKKGCPDCRGHIT